jgi:hypothetical protein
MDEKLEEPDNLNPSESSVQVPKSELTSSLEADKVSPLHQIDKLSGIRRKPF